MATTTELIKQYFDLPELVCKDVHDKFGDKAWEFFDPRLIEDLFYIRHSLAKPIFVNSWQIGGTLSQRGFRCNLCSLVKAKTLQNALYVSAHAQGMAVDFDVKGMTAGDVRTWIKAHSELLPYPCRLEEGVNWVHLDVRTDGQKGRVTTFKA